MDHHDTGTGEGNRPTKRSAVGMRWPHPPLLVLRELRKAHQRRLATAAQQCGLKLHEMRRIWKAYWRALVQDAVASGAFCIPELGVFRWLPFVRPRHYYRASRWFWTGTAGWLPKVRDALDAAVQQTHWFDKVPVCIAEEHALLGLLPQAPFWEEVARQSSAWLRVHAADLLEQKQYQRRARQSSG